MIGCYVKTLQEPSVHTCALCLFEFVGIFVRQEPEIKLCGKQMLMTKPRVLTSMIWCDNVDLALSHIMEKSRMISFENKTRQVPQWSYYLPNPYVDINCCDPW
jgi:hypothetical protein